MMSLATTFILPPKPHFENPVPPAKRFANGVKLVNPISLITRAELHRDYRTRHPTPLTLFHPLSREHVSSDIRENRWYQNPTHTYAHDSSTSWVWRKTTPLIQQNSQR
ncbi:hypothetical protein CGGC5_v008991 [Colletotrichum fructicola Nara gc5]|uniref:Uncharacterized protein n=1 Tax=Colletotrichum fructicola (strain Nara gc5) TaxID=1213859 RepID=A0A7J6J2E9_COLFN|nr:hypothetical protein CGGC5_v008991 [Colletotrichum fructicola Nara gc5]